jgi:hypothetical protein
MRWTRTLKNAGGLIASLSLDMFVLRWLARFDTPERWAMLLSEQADAFAHGQGMCVDDPVPFLHYPSVHAFFVGPVSAYSITGLFCLGCALCVVGVSRQSREASRQIARVEGVEIND